MSNTILEESFKLLSTKSVTFTSANVWELFTDRSDIGVALFLASCLHKIHYIVCSSIYSRTNAIKPSK